MKKIYRIVSIAMFLATLPASADQERNASGSLSCDALKAFYSVEYHGRVEAARKNFYEHRLYHLFTAGNLLLRNVTPDTQDLLRDYMVSKLDPVKRRKVEQALNLAVQRTNGKLLEKDLELISDTNPSDPLHAGEAAVAVTVEGPMARAEICVRDQAKKNQCVKLTLLGDQEDLAELKEQVRRKIGYPEADIETYIAQRMPERCMALQSMRLSVDIAKQAAELNRKLHLLSHGEAAKVSRPQQQQEVK